MPRATTDTAGSFTVRAERPSTVSSRLNSNSTFAWDSVSTGFRSRYHPAQTAAARTMAERKLAVRFQST